MPEKSKSQFVANYTFVMFVLPYLGYLEDWEFVYLQLCKRTSTFWKEHQYAFKRMSDLFYDVKEIEQGIKKHKFQAYPVVNKDYVLTLDLDRNLNKNKEFISEISSLRFPEIKKLTVFLGISVCNQESTLLNNFVSNSITRNIQSFYLRGSPYLTLLSSFHDGLKILLPKVMKQVTIVNFNLELEDFQMLFDMTNNGTELNFYSGRVGRIDESFTLDRQKKHKLKYIDFSNTLEEHDVKKMDKVKIPFIIKEISKTSIKNSLKEIKICPILFSKKKMEEVLVCYNLSANVVPQN